MRLPRLLHAAAILLVLAAGLVLPLPTMWIDTLMLLTITLGCVAATRDRSPALRQVALACGAAMVIASTRALLVGMDSTPRDPWPGGLVEAVGMFFAGGNAVIGAGIALLVLVAGVVVSTWKRAGRSFAAASLAAAAIISTAVALGIELGDAPVAASLRDGSLVAIGLSMSLLVPALVAAARARMRGGSDPAPAG